MPLRFNASATVLGRPAACAQEIPTWMETSTDTTGNKSRVIRMAMNGMGSLNYCMHCKMPDSRLLHQQLSVSAHRVVVVQKSRMFQSCQKWNADTSDITILPKISITIRCCNASLPLACKTTSICCTPIDRPAPPVARQPDSNLSQGRHMSTHDMVAAGATDSALLIDITP